MSGVRIVLAGALGAVFATGCAKGTEHGADVDGRTLDHIDADPDMPDSAPRPDAPDLPDAPPHIDAPPAPDAMPGCTVQVLQLLTNGAFDAGSPAWTEVSPYAIVGAPPAGLTPVSAPNVAWLGGYDDGSDRMYTDVAIPATASAIELRGYLLIDTAETGGVYDFGEVGFLDTSDAVVALLGQWDNSMAGATFVNQTLPSPDAYAGQTLRVEFEAQTDITNPTSFIWDSMELDVTVCQ